MNQAISYHESTQRSFGVYSREEQERIRHGRVAIVGVGCDGGMDAYILARMGIGHLTLIDFDVNEASNLNRQPAAFKDAMGEKKVYTARREFSRFNPETEIDAIDAKLTEENAKTLLQGHDIVIQGMDSMVGRIVFHRAAKELGIPAVTMTGQPPYRSFVSTIMPDGPTYEELFGIDFVVGKTLTGNQGLEEEINELKYERAAHAANAGGSEGWLEQYHRGKIGWGITPERAYITSVNQVRETVDLLIGKPSKAPAPRARIYDESGLKEFGLSENIQMAILDPPNEKNWDFRWF